MSKLYVLCREVDTYEYGGMGVEKIYRHRPTYEEMLDEYYLRIGDFSKDQYDQLMEGKNVWVNYTEWTLIF